MKNRLIHSKAIILDDHKMFAESFSAALEQLNIFKSIHSFTDDREVIDYLVEPNQPATIFLFIDYYLSNKTGLSIINEVRRLNKKIKILMLSSIYNSALVGDVLAYKPDAFLSKSGGIDEVIEALQSIEKDERYTSPYFLNIMQHASVAKSGFTERELELLQYFAKGYSTESTAKALYLSIHTVIAHRRKMMRRIDCHSIVELLAYARNAGLI